MIIYKISNSVNNKVYVGLTKRSVEQRWYSHINTLKSGAVVNSKLYHAMRKYGIDKFKIEEIDKALTLQELSDKEIFWIAKLDCIKNGYNILTGGVEFNSDNALDYWESLSLEEKEEFKKYMAISRQGKSTRKRISKYIGVSQRKKNRWRCVLAFEGKDYSQNFDLELEAAQTYDKLALYFYGETARTNFNKKFTQQELNDFIVEFLKRKRKYGKYKYVNYNKRENKWISYWKINRKLVFHAQRHTEESAYQAQQEFVSNLKKRLTEEDLQNLIAKFKARQTKHKYITYNKIARRWIANWFVNGKRTYIGYQKTEDKAYQMQQEYIKSLT